MAGYINTNNDDAYRTQVREREAMEERRRQEESDLKETLETQRLQWELRDKIIEESRKNR